MKKPTTNFGHSVRTRLLAIANERGVQLDLMKQSQWRAFLRKTGLEFIELPSVVERLAEFLGPLLNDDGSMTLWRHSLKKWGSA